MKKFYNYLIITFLSPTYLHENEKKINMYVPSYDWIFTIWLNSTQQNYEKNWIKNCLNWIEFVFSSIEFNSTQISTRILTMLNSKKKNIVFSSIHFNLRILIQIQFNCIVFIHSICIMEIHSILSHLNGTYFFTKSTHLFHQLIILNSAYAKCGVNLWLLKISRNIWF
jgi:hypothetical protein